MGRSIGSSGHTATGTFGSWVRDVATGERLGVSAGHVCLAKCKPKDSESITALQPFATTGVTIVQPLDSDYEDLLSELQEIADEDYKASEMFGFVHPRAEAARQVSEKELREYKELGDKRALGSVIHAALGIVEEENTNNLVWQDYALIAVGEGTRIYSQLVFSRLDKIRHKVLTEYLTEHLF